MKISIDRLKKEQKIFLEKEVIKFENLDIRKNFSGELEAILTLSWLKSTVPTIELKGNLKGKLNLVCDRCAEPFVKNWESEMDEIYELEKEEIFNKEIDIEPKIKDFVLNNFPIKVLCREDCKGICLGCMTNLNKEKCKCKL
jgi:uncharacterized protein